MASSSSLSRSWLHHVFLSFRGVDVRKGFLSHVLKGLESKGIVAFIDDKMKRGESVGSVLVGAIRQSRVAIVLLSRNYPSSSWCLGELVEIMKCREEDQQIVITIFYEVDPSDVRKQTGDFGKAFDETCVGKTEEVKQAWRQALKDVAGIAGYHSSNCDNEAEMINKVSSDVTAVLGFTPSKDFDDFVGIGARITEIKSKLILQSEQVKVIGILGPAGIGKTTTARVLYNQLSPGFPFSTFLEDIRGSYEKPCGNDYQLKLRLQKKLLSQIYNQRDIEVGHLGVAQEMLSGKKLLVVLDEVNSWWQLEEMAKQRRWVGPGSIIIITTEDIKLLKALGLGLGQIYKMEFPTSYESLQIFCQYAFGQKSPKKDFEKLAWEVTELAGDLPLGLRVMGSYLRGMSMDYWIKTLPRLRSSLDREIESTLRFSYDVLSDIDKDLFLHIACFFVGFEVDSVNRCLEKSSLDVDHGLDVLAHKSLISIEDGYIKMHGLLQQLGKEIVKKQSSEDPGKRQFLWDTTEISDVFDEKTGTGTVLGIWLETSKGEEIQIIESAFDEMNDLRFLKVKSRTSCIPDGLNCLPDKLRLIDWPRCPLRFWPSKFSGKFLVEVIMPFSKFEKLWEGIKPLQCLKQMDLRYSYYLKEIPDLSKASSLEKLNLSECWSLKEYNGCSTLKEGPSSSISTWYGLHRLDVSGCKNIREFPNVPDSIVELDLCNTGIEEVPPWIEKLFRLHKLFMYECNKLKKISRNISKLENLEFFDLSFCDLSERDYDPDFFEAIIVWGPDLKRTWRLRSDLDVHYILPICLPEKALTSPVSLRFRSNVLEIIPDCIRRLSGLIELDVTGCRELVALPQLPGSLLSIYAEDCVFLERIINSSFQNPNICLNFARCSNLNQEARKLIQTSACKYAFLPGEEVPEHFTHRASSGSLTINISPRPLPSSFRFKACIVLSKGYYIPEDHSDDDDDEENFLIRDDDEKDKNSWMRVSCCVTGKHNGLTVPYGSNQVHHMPDLIGCEYSEHLYIFEDSFCINQEDCPETEEATFSELSFVFRFHDETRKVKGCGVRFLKEVPQCILDGNANDEDDDNDDDEEGSDSLNQNQESKKADHCGSALVPGVEVPAHFTHQTTSGSLTSNLTPRAYVNDSEEDVPWCIWEFSNDEDGNLLIERLRT